MAITTSSVSTYKEFENKRKEQRDDAILNIGIGGAGVFATSKLLATDTGQSVASKIFKLNTANSYFTFGPHGSVKYDDIKIKNKITLGDLALDFSKTLEEISPLKILRTFHVSSFISPYTIPKSNIKSMHVTADDLMLDEQYFRKLFESRGNNVSQTMMNDLFNKGGTFENGQLKTLSGDLVLENARLVKLAPSPLDEQGRSTHPFLNRVYEKFRNTIGETDDSGFFRSAMSPRGGVGIIGGKSEAGMARDWARAYGRLALEPGFKLFDRPLDVLAEVVDRTGLPKKYNMATSLRDTFYLGAGAGGDYTQSVPKMFATMGKRIAALTVAGALLYNYGDAAVRDIASDDSAYKKGIMAGVATGYTEARVGFAEAWSDRFQDYKVNQEHLAEGSTSLLTLAGFPLAGALFGANIGYAMRLKDATVKGVAAADIIAHTEGQGKLLNTMLNKGSTSGPSLTRVGRFAAIGALIGLVPALPFLPGALIGDSSEELKKIYSGEEDVAVRSTRFWGSGGKEWSGGKIKYFTKSWYSQLMNNAEDVTKYGDQETKDKLNPVLHPLDYLRNPYQLEELNQDKSPYAVWGMEVSYGGAFGKLYQGTIGALIKPDLVNKRLDDYIESGSVNSPDGVELKQQVSDTEKELIDEGLMLAPEAAKLTTDTELGHTAYSALTDFAGLKGWIGSLGSNAVHSGLGDPGLQLDRSGAMNNSARSLVESNLGGMGPVGESLRRFIPTNAGSILDRANPLRNQMPCLLKGTDVVLEGNILTKAENLKIGDRIVSDSGSIETVLNVAIATTDKSIKIDVYGNNLYNFNFSWNHPILIYGKGYVDAENVLVNDYVAYPITKYARDVSIVDILSICTEYREYDDTYIYYGKTVHKKTTRVKRFWKDTDLFYLYGVYAAEGSRNGRLKGFKLSGAIDDKWDNEIERIFSLYEVSYSTQIVAPGGKNYISYCNPLRSILINIIPGNAHTKIFHESIINHSNSEAAMKRLLNGLIDGDGYYIRTSDDRIRLGLHTVSACLAYQTRNLFIDVYGVGPSTTAEKNKDGLTMAIHVSINGKHCKKIAEDFGYQIHEKIFLKDMKHSWSDGVYVYTRVRSVTVTYGDIDIYAQEVSGNHTFCVALFATHNTWMPHDVNNYWIDFSSSDPYAKVEKGYFRLPGEGYAELHPELKDTNPNDYADIHKYKILSDVAMGSDEYYRYKDIMDARSANNQLTDYEKSIYGDIVSQTNERSVQKQFFEPLSDNELSKAGILSSAMSSFWDAATGAAELPTESLTFLRPGAKLIHKRTALEDYYATQVDGTDTGMWTKPYDHFIKPAINKTVMSDTGVPEEVMEKRSVNEYFDKLEYIKYRNLYKQAVKDGDSGLAYTYKKKYQTTISGALASGLDDNMEVTRGYIALPDQEKAYFAAFSGATSKEDREAIVNAESTSISELYSKIWERRDAITNNPDNPEAQASAIQNIVKRDEQSIAVSNPGLYASYKMSGEQNHSSLSEYVADKEAESYIKNTTGMPDKSFSGWDPRIDINDIKLKTLSVGKEDVRAYGFWEGDESRLARLTVVNEEDQVVNEIDKIKAGIREEKSRAAAIKSELYKRGISVDSVQFHKSKTEDINMRIGA